MRQVRAERRFAPPTPAPDPTRPRWFWLTPAFATATIVFAALSAWFWALNRRDAQEIGSLQAQLSVAQLQSRELATTRADFDRMLGAPSTIHVALSSQPGQPHGRAGLLYNQQLGAVAWSGQLPPAPADKSYQLWLVPASGSPISLGVFSRMEASSVATTRISPGAAPKAFAITLEPLGGRPQPTGPKVLVGVPG